MPDHYILRGRDVIPVDMWTWAEFLEHNLGDRIVGFWKFKSCDVSTVFLGLDHSFLLGGPPILFETLVFGGGPMDGDGERYSTYDQAEMGHLHWCEVVSSMENKTHWRRLKRWRNHYQMERRRMNNKVRRRRQLQLMQEMSAKLVSKLKEKEDGEG